MRNPRANLLFVTNSNTDSSLDWDFGYDFDVGTYAFLVRTTGSDDGEAQSPLYTLLDPHLVSFAYRGPSLERASTICCTAGH